MIIRDSHNYSNLTLAKSTVLNNYLNNVFLYHYSREQINQNAIKTFLSLSVV